MHGTVLHDGFLVGTWNLGRTDDRVMLSVDHIGPLTRAARSEITCEGRALLAFLPGAAGDHNVRFRQL